MEGCRSLFLKVTIILEIEIDTYARFDSERKIRTCRPRIVVRILLNFHISKADIDQTYCNSPREVGLNSNEPSSRFIANPAQLFLCEMDEVRSVL